MRNLYDSIDPDYIVFSAIQEDENEELPVWGEYEKGVFKAFKEKKYNQINIDPYSCFLVAPFQAISNFTENDISYDLMKNTFDKLRKDSKFTPKVGGKISDGMEYAVRAYNEEYKDNLKFKKVPLTVQNIIEALKTTSPIVCAINYSKSYFSDEQKDGDAWINKIESIGKMGHCIQIVKINTQDDILIKYLENYTGYLKYDIIGCDFTKFRELFGSNGWILYR